MAYGGVLKPGTDRCGYIIKLYNAKATAISWKDTSTYANIIIVHHPEEMYSILSVFPTIVIPVTSSVFN